MSHGSGVVLITGTTSGVGLALARSLLTAGWRVIGVARRDAPLDAGAYHHLKGDLGDIDGLRRLLTDEVVPAITATDPARVGLVNNAALIGQLTWQRNFDPVDLGKIFAVNAVAPLALMGFFAAAVPPSVPLRIVNVSSGAAHSPLPGLSDYSATKAALRLAGRSWAAEMEREGRSPRQAALLSYEPGLVDTGMQEQARDTSPEAFPAHELFQEFNRQGQLVPPDKVVGEIVAFLESDPDERFSERRYGES